MRLAYITVSCPFSDGETFIIEEMRKVLEAGVDLTIIPLRPERIPRDSKAKELLPLALESRLFSLTVIRMFLKVLFRSPLLILKLFIIILRRSRNLRILLKNLTVFPKGVYIGDILKKRNIEHIHVHWASTPTTVAWIASKISGIPFSFTAHRWDIGENNLLSIKCEDADFVRVISLDGKNEILRITGRKDLEGKLKVLYMGVEIPPHLDKEKENRPFTIACPANFVEKKGHKYFLNSIKNLNQNGKNFICYLIGDGPLKEEIEDFISKNNLKEKAILTGRLPHSEVMGLFRKGEIDLVVLPSIETSQGEKEGIPVVLMEAMAHCIPVVSTPTGGIPELITQDTGILVPQKDEDALQKAITDLINNVELRNKLGKEGRRRVEELFNLNSNVRKLLSYIEKSIRVKKNTT